MILETAERTKEHDSLGCAKLVVFCNAPDDNPFMAGAFHGVTETDAIINVGVSGPGVVKHALEEVRGKSFEGLCETIKNSIQGNACRPAGSAGGIEASRCSIWYRRPFSGADPSDRRQCGGYPLRDRSRVCGSTGNDGGTGTFE